MSGFHRRTIRKLIRDKLNKFIASIDDPTLAHDIKDEVLVTGGAVCSMMLGEKVNDYDVYFKSLEMTKRVAEYYVQKFNQAKTGTDTVEYKPAVKVESRLNLAGESEDRVLIYMKSAGTAGVDQEAYKYFEAQPDQATEDFVSSLSASSDDMDQIIDLVDEVKTPTHKYKPVFMTDNAITLTDRTQIIIRFYGEADQIHKNYDYLHCTGVYDYASDKVIITPEMMECLLSKTLVYSGSLYPLASVLRMRKFIKRGWRISAGQVLKMMRQVSDINFEDPVQLKEQLMGVDVAYMHQLITALQNRDANQRIDSTYLAVLIDTIFEE
jgi:hypothetical protein